MVEPILLPIDVFGVTERFVDKSVRGQSHFTFSRTHQLYRAFSMSFIIKTQSLKNVLNSITTNLRTPEKSSKVARNHCYSNIGIKMLI